MPVAIAGPFRFFRFTFLRKKKLQTKKTLPLPTLTNKIEPMTIVKNFQELENALKAHTYNIEIPDEQLGNAVVLAGRIQNETLDKVILKRLPADASCRVAIGRGVVIRVGKELADETLQTLGLFDSYRTEVDVEDVKVRKVNLYYNA